MTINDIENDVINWAHERDLIHGTTAEKQCLKLQSEVGELSDAILKCDTDGIIDGIGDCLVVLTNLTEKLQLGGLAYCFRSAFLEIENRTGKMVNGTFIKD